MKKFAKRAALTFAVLGVIAVFYLPAVVVGERVYRPQIMTRVTGVVDADQVMPNAAPMLKLMTLNLAHGRSRGFHQAFLKAATIRSNLDAIALVLDRENPVVVALQEADGPSMWSGGFSHVSYLARQTRTPYSLRGAHVDGLKLTYGTALLSRHALSDPLSYRFVPSPPTFSKGFVVSAIAWPGTTDVFVDIVSVHLDFSRAAVRERQVQEMVEALGDRKRPLVVMGDFNCQWTDKEPSLRRLAEGLLLKTFKPESDLPSTFPATRKRLDWILVSPELALEHYRVLDDVVSDHLAVVAELRRVPGPR